jgi:hypothetical protein
LPRSGRRRRLRCLASNPILYPLIVLMSASSLHFSEREIMKVLLTPFLPLPSRTYDTCYFFPPLLFLFPYYIVWNKQINPFIIIIIIIIFYI